MTEVLVTTEDPIDGKVSETFDSIKDFISKRPIYKSLFEIPDAEYVIDRITVVTTYPLKETIQVIN